MGESVPRPSVERLVEEVGSSQFSRDLFTILDTDGTIRRVNAAVEQTLGFRSEELVGRSLLELVHPEDLPAVGSQLTDLRSGRETFRFACRDGTYRQLSVMCAVPLGDLAQLYMVACEATQQTAVPRDIAEGRNGAAAVTTPEQDLISLVFLDSGPATNDVDVVQTRETTHLRRRLDLILNSVTDGVFGVNLLGNITFANRAAVRLLGWDHASLIGQPQQTITPALEPGAANAIHAALERGVSSFVEDEVFRKCDGTLLAVEYMSAAVRDKDETVGVVVTFRTASNPTDQLHMQYELRAARALQQQLYPKIAPRPHGFDIAGTAVPAAMAGGDYYDFITLSDDKIALAVGDVSGHGLSSALQMVELRAYLRAILDTEQDLATVLERLNRFLIEDTLEGAFASLFLAELDVRSRTLSYIGAGHEARLLSADGGVEHLLSSGLVLGVVPELSFQDCSLVRLRPGDVVVIVTDGITEALSASAQMFEYGRVLDAVRQHRHASADTILGAVYAAVHEFSEARPLEDDMTAMIVKTL